MFCIICINTSLNNTKIPEVITAKCFQKCHNNEQFIPRVYTFINHKMTHRYIYFRFTRQALQLRHVTMLNYLHGYKRLCCPKFAYRQTENKWSFFVEHLNSWFAGTHENHENWYTTNANEFTVNYIILENKIEHMEPLTAELSGFLDGNTLNIALLM